MKSIPGLLFPAAVLALLALPACEIDTLEGPRPVYSPSPTVVINEVFTLAETDPSRFTWIEFYNPTDQSVDVTGWTLECMTTQYRLNVLVYLDSMGGIIFRTQPFPSDISFGTFRIPIFRFVDDPTTAYSTTIEPGKLLTVVDNETRLRDITNWGPAEDISRNVRPAFVDTIDQIDTVSTSDTLTVIRAGWSTFLFSLKVSDQLVLRNAAGAVVDVVRYGSYSWPGPGPDPYPGNQSAGFLPPYESLCRYAGGFKTNPMAGNTANDFYITDQFNRPIPHWYSQKQRTE